MTLHIQIGGRERFTAPYLPEKQQATADLLNEYLPALREMGRVLVYVTDDTGVAHIIATR